jgi:D-inositol-3-phosphate glycosyltransferase
VNLHVAMLSVHTCPLAALGGKETGGMNVYVREVSRELGRMGVSVDVFTRSQDPSIQRVVRLGERARVIHLAAGAEAPMARERVYDHMDEFVEGVEAWRIAEAIDYDLIHAHYWLSGVAALTLKRRWSVPVLQMFHTLARLKNRVARSAAELEPLVRVEEETRIVSEADRIVAANVV